MTTKRLKKRVIKITMLSVSLIMIIICFFHTYLSNLGVYRSNQIAWFLILYFFSLTLIFWLSNRLFDYFFMPVQEILKGIHELKNGNTGYRININSKDELQEIGDMLNETAKIMEENQRVSKQILQKEKKQKEQLLKVYSDVIASVTQGKFNLVEPRKFDLLSSQGELLGKVLLEEPQDVNKARLLVQQILQEKKYSVRNLMHVKLCVSEATTNVLTHARTGELVIKKVANRLRIIVSDHGPGMDYDQLPHMVFFQGFSTTISMGVGFSLIYKFADQITLSTSEEGTGLMLDFLIDSCLGKE